MDASWTETSSELQDMKTWMYSIEGWVEDSTDELEGLKTQMDWIETTIQEEPNGVLAILAKIQARLQVMEENQAQLIHNVEILKQHLD